MEKDDNIHSHSIRNREEIERSCLCGCFSCIRIFEKEDIEDYIDDGLTALCPYCQVDTVIGDACGLELSVDLLSSLNKKWFR